MSFWDIIWFIVVSFAFFAYLMIMFRIVVDLFRDRDMRGVVKAVWVIALIVVPFLTALIYIIARGDGMSRRDAAQLETARAHHEAYIKSVAGGTASAAEQIAHGKQLLDSGAINAEEFASLKAKALAT
jgi:hypothetical protein